MKTIQAKPHPEAASDEIFLTNTDPDGFASIGWVSKRRGETPYDIHGKIVRYYETHDFRPVFVKTSEIVAAGFQVVN